MEGTLSLDRLHPVRIYPVSFLTFGRVSAAFPLLSALPPVPRTGGMHAHSPYYWYYPAIYPGLWLVPADLGRIECWRSLLQYSPPSPFLSEVGGESTTYSDGDARSISIHDAGHVACQKIRSFRLHKLIIKNEKFVSRLNTSAVHSK